VIQRLRMCIKHKLPRFESHPIQATHDLPSLQDLSLFVYPLHRVCEMKSQWANHVYDIRHSRGELITAEFR
jgi:hypothetical protein